MFAGELGEAAAAAAKAERLGCAGMMAPEVAHDPFLPLTLAASVTHRIRLTTGIAVAFARTPMTVAVTASDIHRLSGGRFVLGLGSQIKAHITRRFSMPWSAPAPRMREFVAAVRAIWKAWEEGSPLQFDGDYYHHSLMTPMFSHGPSACGWPRIALAGVGPHMTGLAGEIADGFIAHGFTTADYVRDVTLPNLRGGLERAGRARGDIEVSVPAMIAFATDEHDPRLAATRATIAFYGSTPAYLPVLDHHGWSGLGEELHAMSRRGDWAAMGQLIDDNVLHTFAVVGDTRHIARELRARYEGLVERIQIGVAGDESDTAELIDALHSI
jgi:probable F420-dependent oxidoreductase